MILLSGCRVVAPESPDILPAYAPTEVETVGELLEAIKPDADIMVKSGQYNLSRYIEEACQNGIANGMIYTENKEGENPIWLMLHIGETAVWMSRS